MNKIIDKFKEIFSRNKEYWYLWLKAAGIRALRTFAVALASYISVGSTMGQINWILALSVGATAVIASFLTSVFGLPELSDGTTEISHIKAALVRGIKTFAQVALAGIATGAALSDINWGVLMSGALVAAIYTVLISFKGLPESNGTSTDIPTSQS